MTEVQGNAGASQADPNAGTSGSGAAADGGAGGSQGGADEVSQKLAKAEETNRNLQSQRDRLYAENERLKAANAAPAAAANDGAAAAAEFDPVAFRREVLRDVVGATALTQAAIALKTEFPHADPSLFGERLAEFGSPEALRLAAEVSHSRVASAIETESKAIEERVRAEMAAKHGGNSGSPAAGSDAGADPTPAQLSAMSIAELDALEKARPGVIDRVLLSASN